ncbi:MAG: catechol 1,2-dioxygenase [Candidatus Binataceae bacterium]
MGEVRAAVFTTHVPRLMIRDLQARKAYMGRDVTTFYDAMAALEHKLASLEFDTYVVIDTHWFTTLEYVINARELLAGVYTSEELPHMLHDLEYEYAGDPELALAVETAAKEHGIRAIASAHRNLPVHYPTLNVMHYLNPGSRRRVISMGVCQIASVQNDVAFGAALGDAIKRSKRRVVLVASGGLSHRFHDYDHVLEHTSASPEEITTQVNRQYDERIMELFKRGDHAEVLASAEDFRAKCLPEGRFSHYLIMAGAMGGKEWQWRGEQFGRYESALGTGQAIFCFAAE